MAKRKDLLLKESTVSRMMGLAGIGALTNPFLRESYGEEGKMEEGYGKDLNEMEEEDEEDPHGGMWPGEVEKMYDDEYNSRFGDEEDEEDEMSGYELDDAYGDEEDDDEYSEDELEGDYDWKEVDKFSDMDSGEGDDDEYSDYEDDEEELEEAKETCKKCGKKIHEGSCGGGYMQESIHKSMKRLKRLLEQAEADAPPPAPEGDVPPPETAPGDDDQMESKIKEFVKKLGELVQETLGVEVTVEEGEGEPEMPEGEAGAPPPPAPAGGAEAPPPAPLAEAINRLVNKVARRVKARLMEAKKKEDPKAKKMKMMKEKQMAAKKKEMEAAKKKKEMEMKKKKAAAMAKKK